MAGSKKSKKVTPTESDNEMQSDEESYNGPEEIQATFEGHNLEGHDFHGIKTLLQQLFLTAHIDLSQVTDILIAQNGVGSVLKQSYNDSDDEEDIEMVDESDVFGVTTVLNLAENKGKPCVSQLYQILEEEVQKGDVNQFSKLKQILDSNKLGLLINERFVNIPSKISYPMLNSLQDEIYRVNKKNSGYNFDYYVLISKLWKTKDTDEIIYSNDEEEIFEKNNDFSFQYSVANKTDTGLSGKWKSEDKELIPFRQLILFKADKFSSILNEIQQHVLN